MTAVLALSVGLLVAVGVYLLLARKVFPAILGLSLLAHGANLVMLAAGDRALRAPIVRAGIDPRSLADPVPQALILTAIVISMAVTLYLLATYTATARALDTESIDPAPPNDTGREANTVEMELAGQVRRSP